MGKIIALVSLKGGVSKTTSAMHLAACAAHESPTIVIDADEERSASRWADHAEALPFKVIPGERDGLARQAKRYADTYTVIIDTPPNNREILHRAASIADTVVIPVKPTGLDVDRLMPTLELLAEVEATRGELDAAILLTQWDGRTVLAREAADALQGYPLLEQKIRHLQAYAQAFGTVPNFLLEYDHVWGELNG